MKLTPPSARLTKGACAAVFLSALFLLTACSVPRANVEPEGTLDVLGPFPGFAKKGLPDDWVFDGPEEARDRLRAVTLDSVPALKIETNETGFVAALRTQAMMLATPFLSWAWNVEMTEGGDHPVRMVVGFLNGNPEDGQWKRQPFDWLGRTLPSHDRAISIAWGESALERGNFTIPAGATTGATAPRYVARGGRENTGQWWLETVDLADLYARTWPGEDMSRVRITFIGVAVEASRAASVAHISGVRLNR